ncbi:MAG: hypothetical protein DSM106950_21075 [Stigonema ocellatum SAG 48.90 = DSM 106950]|nr:hypothetical protein [Stigonema ocellatum SAG 48.90 = DSM 106950]
MGKTSKNKKEPQLEAPKQTLLSIKPLKQVESPSPPAPQEPEPVTEKDITKNPTDAPSLESAKQKITLPKPVKRVPVTPPPVAPVEPQTEPEQLPAASQIEDAPLTKVASGTNEGEEQAQPQEDAIFQAVGIITGDVNFNDEGKTTVALGGKQYPLYYISSHRRAFDALKKEIEAKGNSNQRLIVYPRVMHFPKRDQPHYLSFQLIGFDSGKNISGITKDLQDFEFRLCGLWQFIPVCQTPCISVFRNFTPERLNYIKAAEASTKVKFMKASHIPLIWKDAPVRPFRFNPKAEKEDQGRPVFVKVLTKFLPHRDLFGFVELLSDPTPKAPKFLKVSKADKAEALKTKLSKTMVGIQNPQKPKKRDWG